MTIAERLVELGVALPEVAAPLASYVPAMVIGDQVHTSGQLPIINGELWRLGKVGGEVDVQTGAEAARICALNALAAAAQVAGGVERLKRVLKVVVYVASTSDFTDQPIVANGASDLLVEIFGENGKHIRSAVGVAVLPKNAPVEVELVCLLGE